MTEVTTNFQYIRISNFNRAYGTPSDFTYDLSNEVRLHECKSLWIQAVTLPNVFYNIDTHNNTLPFVAFDGISSITRTVTVPVGQYDITTLLSTLKALIDAELPALVAGATIDLVLNPITNKIDVTLNNFNAISLAPETIGPNIGLTESLVINTSGSLQSTPDLAGEKMVYLHSKDINLGKTTISTLVNGASTVNSNRNVSAFCSIPVKVPYLGIIHYESYGSDTDHINLEGIKDLCNVSIKLRSVDGRILQLEDNHELTIVLKCFF